MSLLLPGWQTQYQQVVCGHFEQIDYHHLSVIIFAVVVTQKHCMHLTLTVVIDLYNIGKHHQITNNNFILY